MGLNVGKNQDDIVLKQTLLELSRYTGDNNVIITVKCHEFCMPGTCRQIKIFNGKRGH